MPHKATQGAVDMWKRATRKAAGNWATECERIIGGTLSACKQGTPSDYDHLLRTVIEWVEVE
jgi:hypothetical protein